jgi:uncharacterized delta-60 repeat protein
MRLKLAVAAFLIAMAALPSAARAYPGDFDSSFSADGIVAVGSVPGGPSLVAPQSTGKVVVAPAFNPGGSNSLQVIRLTGDGSVDETFGNAGGTLSLSCGPAVGLAAAPDDSLYVASHDCLVKLTSNGQLDEAFGDDGVVFVFRAGALALDETGRPLVAGVDPNGDPYVRRFEQDGDPDPSFSSDGKATLENHVAPLAPLALSASTGNVFVGGTAGGDPVVIKLDSSGSVDPAFGSDWTAKYDAPGFEPTVNDLQETAGGDVLIAGAQGSTETTNGFVAKFDSEGLLDPSFAQNGGYFSGAPLSSFAIRPDGSIIASGTSSYNCPGRAGPYCIVQADGFLVGLTKSGSIDSSFGDEGLVLFDLDGLDYISDVALDPAGESLLVGGSAEFECCGEPARTFVSRHLLAGAVRDRDADGYADAEDQCPPRFSTTARGCPSYSREIKVTLTRTEEGLEVLGNTRSPAEPCWYASDPRLQRKTAEGWRLESFIDTYAGIPGLFKFTIDHSNHRHRLILNRDRVEGEAICKAARPVVLPR